MEEVAFAQVHAKSKGVVHEEKQQGEMPKEETCLAHLGSSKKVNVIGV